VSNGNSAFFGVNSATGGGGHGLGRNLAAPPPPHIGNSSFLPLSP
jgi:hypothetical protein